MGKGFDKRQQRPSNIRSKLRRKKCGCSAADNDDNGIAPAGMVSCESREGRGGGQRIHALKGPFTNPEVIASLGPGDDLAPGTKNSILKQAGLK
jgi:hypothetical protein